MLKKFLYGVSLFAISTTIASAATNVGAGVFLTATGDDGETYCFLAERKSGAGWVNLGGLRDPKDLTPEESATRETFEESMGLIKLNPASLAYAPYADFVSTPFQKKGEKLKPKKVNYRMYFQETEAFSVDTFYKRMDELKNTGNKHFIEMSDFGWFKMKDIMTHLAHAGPLPELFEVEDINHNKRKIKLFDNMLGMLRQQKVLDYYKSMFKEDVVDVSPAEDESHNDFKGKAYAYTQSEAHLKLVLGDNYVENNLSANIDSFLKNFHDPLYAQRKAASAKKINKLNKSLVKETSDTKRAKLLEKLEKAKKGYETNDIDNQHNNKKLKATLLKAMQEEKNHSDKVVLYHGTQAHINFLFDIITAFRKQLFNLPGSNLKIVRTIDDFFKDIHSIEDFERKMDAQELLKPYKTNTSKERFKYNYLDGYTAGGIAANVSLFGNHGYKFSSSFAYLLNAYSERPAPSFKLLKGFFNMLGLDDEELGSTMLNRLQEYAKVFLKYFSDEKKIDLMKKHNSNDSFLNSEDFVEVTNSHNGALLQMFIDPKTVNQTAHITEVVGDRVALKIDPHNHATTKPTQVLGQMRSDPVSFEKILRTNHKLFQNQLKWGHDTFDSDPNFVHANILEARMVALPEAMSDGTKYHTNTYFLNEINHEAYLKDIEELAKRDVAKIRALDLDYSGLFKAIPKNDKDGHFVNDIMMKAMVDNWKVDLLADKDLINRSFKAKLFLNGHLVEGTYTPLTFALTKGYQALALTLIEKGADLNQAQYMSLKGVYDEAIANDREEVVIKILSQGISKPVSQKNLNDAIRKGAVKTVERMLEHGLEPYTTRYRNPLGLALELVVQQSSLGDEFPYRTFSIFKKILDKHPQLATKLSPNSSWSKLEKALAKDPENAYLKAAHQMIKAQAEMQNNQQHQAISLLIKLLAQLYLQQKLQAPYLMLNGGEWRIPILVGSK